MPVKRYPSVAQPTRDDLDPAVVAVEADLGDDDADAGCRFHRFNWQGFRGHEDWRISATL
jgi:hypothetical protein